MVSCQSRLLCGCGRGKRTGADYVYKCGAGIGNGTEIKIPACQRSADAYAESGKFSADDGKNDTHASGSKLRDYPNGY